MHSMHCISRLIALSFCHHRKMAAHVFAAKPSLCQASPTGCNSLCAFFLFLVTSSTRFPSQICGDFTSVSGRRGNGHRVTTACGLPFLQMMMRQMRLTHSSGETDVVFCFVRAVVGSSWRLLQLTAETD